MRLTIKLKLCCAFAVIVALSLASAWGGTHGMSVVDGWMNAVIHGSFAGLDRANRLDRKLLNTQQQQLQLLALNSKAERQMAGQKMKQSLDDLHQSIIQAVKNKHADKTSSSKLLAIYDKLGELDQDFYSKSLQFYLAAEKDDIAESRQIYRNILEPSATAYKQHLLNIIHFAGLSARGAAAEADNSYRDLRLVLLCVAGVSLLLSVLIAALTIRAITHGLGQIDKMAKAMALGDLDEEVSYHSRDGMSSVM